MADHICPTPSSIEYLELRVTQLEVNLSNLLWLMEPRHPRHKTIRVAGCFPVSGKDCQREPLLPLKELHDEALE